MSVITVIKNSRKKQWSLGVVLALAAVSLFFIIRPHSTTTRPPAAPLPVRVAPVEVQNIPEYLNGLGTVIPSQTSLVRSRVDGTLLR
ncbi:MAG: multidrug transporter subunit MdtA, partial [Desulfovibrionaceae bacterium]